MLSNFNRKHGFLAGVVGIAVLAMSSVGIVSAQTPDNTVVLVGTIESLTETSLTLNQWQITFEDAQIDAALEMGLAVAVEGELLANGSIIATEIAEAEASDILPGELQIIGAPQDATDTSLSIGGLEFDTSDAEITGDLSGDDTIAVRAAGSDSGALSARLVLDAESMTQSFAQTEASELAEGEFEIVGTLEAAGDGFITVSGQTINTANAEFTDSVVMGALVRATVTADDDQSLVASSVRRAVFDDVRLIENEA